MAQDACKGFLTGQRGINTTFVQRRRAYLRRNTEQGGTTPSYRHAQRNLGAAVLSVWMPRLEPDVAAMIEARRLTFGMARDGLVPEGASFAPIGGFERMIRRWLEQMEHEFSAVSSWLL